MSKLLHISTYCKIYAKPGDTYAAVYDTSLELPSVHIRAMLTWFQKGRDTRLRRRLLAAYLASKSHDIKTLSELAGITNSYKESRLKTELENLKEEIQDIINQSDGGLINWCHLPPTALHYLCQGTRREVFIIVLLGILMSREKYLHVFHISQKRTAKRFQVIPQAISRAVCQLIKDGILIQVITPGWLIRKRGSRYIFSDNNYKKRLPTNSQKNSPVWRKEYEGEWLN